MILVLGATGMFGSRVGRGLLGAGKPVRALTGHDPMPLEQWVQQHAHASRSPAA